MAGNEFDKAATSEAQRQENSRALQKMLSESPEKVNTKQALAVIEMGIEPNMLLQDDSSLLIYACNVMNAEVVTALLAQGADPNLANKRKEVPLHYAAKGYVPAVVDALLKHGADIYARDEFNDSALEMCEKTTGNGGKTWAVGHFNVLKLLRDGVQSRIRRDMETALFREEIQNFTGSGCATNESVKPMKRLQIKTPEK